jgi:regulatory factor X
MGQDGAVPIQSHPPSTVASASYPPSQQSMSVRQMPHFPSIEEALGSSSSASSHSVAARELWGWFMDHLDALLDSVRYFRFDQFEMHIRSFWTNLSGNHREVAHAPAIAGLMAKGDAIVYDVRPHQGYC